MGILESTFLSGNEELLPSIILEKINDTDLVFLFKDSTT
tara:strand:+ start:46 stop:162 length:117 start_codon:yes stop_codon:yes gene_type:complete